MTETVDLKSGAKLQLNLPDFPVSLRLLEVVVNEFKRVDIDIGKIDFKQDLTALDAKTVNMFKNGLCQLIGSEDVKKSVMACAAVCLHNGVKVTMASFNPEEARQDYLPMVWEVTKLNLSPFFKGLDLSSLTAKQKALGASPV